MNKTPALCFTELTYKQIALVNKAGAFKGAYPLASAIEKRTARSLEKKGWGVVEIHFGSEWTFRLNQKGEDKTNWLTNLVLAPPFLTENGKVSPLVPVAIIDRESSDEDWADALAHSVNIKQSDF